jgi:hypothetical protein
MQDVGFEESGADDTQKGVNRGFQRLLAENGQSDQFHSLVIPDISGYIRLPGKDSDIASQLDQLNGQLLAVFFHTALDIGKSTGSQNDNFHLKNAEVR